MDSLKLPPHPTHLPPLLTAEIHLARQTFFVNAP